MKRFTITLIAFALLLPSLFAQTSFCINGGLAYPMGDFGKTTIGQGAFAKQGYCLGLEVLYFAPSRIGFGVQLNRNVNPIDVDALGLNLKTDFGFSKTELTAVGHNASYSGLAMGGYKIVDAQRFSVSSLVGLGAAVSSLTDPVRYNAYRSLTKYDLVSLDFSSKYSFAYTIGARFVYYLSDSVGLSAGVWYYTTNADYIIADQVIGKAGQTNLSEYSVGNNVLDFRLGIVFGN